MKTIVAEPFIAAAEISTLFVRNDHELLTWAHVMDPGSGGRVSLYTKVMPPVPNADESTRALIEIASPVLIDSHLESDSRPAYWKGFASVAIRLIWNKASLDLLPIEVWHDIENLAPTDTSLSRRMA
jgi:hypothetical protein